MKNVLRKFIPVFVILFTLGAHSQSKNFIDQNYLETTAKAEKFVNPDIIKLNIILKEEDTKGKTSIENLEKKLKNSLKKLNINISKNLVLSNANSNFKDYFLRKTDVQKGKYYILTVNSAFLVGEVVRELESNNISNVSIKEVDYSKKEEAQLEVKLEAVKKAKFNAEKITDALDQKVIKAIHISDNNVYSNYNNYRKSNAPQMEMRLDESEGFTKNDGVKFKKLKYTASVSVKFAIE